MIHAFLFDFVLIIIVESHFIAWSLVVRLSPIVGALRAIDCFKMPNIVGLRIEAASGVVGGPLVISRAHFDKRMPDIDAWLDTSSSMLVDERSLVTTTSRHCVAPWGFTMALRITGLHSFKDYQDWAKIAEPRHLILLKVPNRVLYSYYFKIIMIFSIYIQL